MFLHAVGFWVNVEGKGIVHELCGKWFLSRGQPVEWGTACFVARIYLISGVEKSIRYSNHQS
jgi:hypothetical protein